MQKVSVVVAIVAVVVVTVIVVVAIAVVVTVIATVAVIFVAAFIVVVVADDSDNDSLMAFDYFVILRYEFEVTTSDVIYVPAVDIVDVLTIVVVTSVDGVNAAVVVVDIKLDAKFLYTKLRGPSHGIFVQCIALKAESKTLTCLMFTFIICQNTHSTNPTCDLNSVTKL